MLLYTIMGGVLKIIYCMPHPIDGVEVAIFISIIDEMKKHYRLD